MQETTCPQCGGTFASAWGVKGAPEDGAREHYCSEECRDIAETVKEGSRLPAPPPEPWDLEGDPFAE